ncbi:MAG: glycosyltransferase, partial [Chitinivibrionales bacterium]|nr:glycosyltransferase [Chitinivibrionales bacterium]MBD3394297.1 glycosyltransferase [Chitinivibrionales bacterium]
GTITVSAVIPAYNAAATLGRTLDDLGRQTRVPGEVIVVDDGSTDTTADIAGRAGCRVIRLDRNAGCARARNLGFAEARGEIIYFLDADCAPEPECLERLVAEITRSDRIGIAGGAEIDGNGPDNRFALAYYVSECYDFAPQLPAKRRMYLRTSNLLVRRNVLEKLTGFREHLSAAEDLEFCFRATRAGYDVVFRPDARIVHNHNRRDLKSFAATFYRNGIGGTLFRLMHKPHVPFSRFFPASRLSFALLSPLLILYSLAHIIRKNVRYRPLRSFVHVLPLVFIGRLCWSAGAFHALGMDPHGSRPATQSIPQER